MSDRDPEVLSEEEAARVWGRAAELQAEADGEGDAPLIESGDDGLPTPGYAIDHVRSAAEQAGIAPEFVESALVDLRVEQAMPEKTAGRTLARRILKDPPEVVAIRRMIEASPAEVFAAMQAVLPAAPYQLTLTGEQGDPLDGGVLVFTLPGGANPFEKGFAFDVAEAGLKQAIVALRPIDGHPHRCEVVLHSPATAEKLGASLATFAATVFGVVGGIIVTPIAATLGGPTIGIAGAVVGIGTGAMLGLKGFRALYRYAVGRGRKALDGMIGAVAARAKGVWGA